MKRVVWSCLVVPMVAFAVLSAPASVREAPPLGGIVVGMLSFLTNSDVREELKLSEEQTKKIEELVAERREAFRAARQLSSEERVRKQQELLKTHDEKLSKILTRKQMKRGEQICLQILGTLAFSLKPQVAAALKLTDEQKEEIKLIRTESLQESRALRQAGQLPTREQSMERAVRRDEKLLNVLTREQKKKWQDLIGEPFKRKASRSEESTAPAGVGRDAKKP